MDFQPQIIDVANFIVAYFANFFSFCNCVAPAVRTINLLKSKKIDSNFQNSPIWNDTETPYAEDTVYLGCNRSIWDETVRFTYELGSKKPETVT